MRLRSIVRLAGSGLAITLNADRTAVDYDHQSVTFSGTVTGRWPDGTVEPLSGQTVTLGSGGQAATTASDGSYTLTAKPAPGPYNEQLVASQTMDSAVSPGVQITANVDPVRLTATASAGKVKAGQAVTVSGTVDYEPGSQWQPFAGTQVQVWDDSLPVADNPVGSATVGTDGKYTMQAYPYLGGTLHVYAGALPCNSALALPPGREGGPAHACHPAGFHLGDRGQVQRHREEAQAHPLRVS